MREPFLFFSFVLISIALSSCRKDTYNYEESVNGIEYDDSLRSKFVGEWNFTFRHNFEGFAYDSVSQDYVYTTSSDTIWQKQGNISKDPNSSYGLVVNYGPNESDFAVTTDGLDVTCMQDCENALYDTLGPYAYWWFLAEGVGVYDSAAIYNMGVYAYYGSPDSWNIVGYPK